MEKKTIREIAEERGYEVVQTTEYANGYPSGIELAIIGFETEEEARQVASEEDLMLIWIDRQDGWRLWHRGEGFIKAAELDHEDIGASFFAYRDTDVFDALESYIHDSSIDTETSIDNLEYRIKNCREALDEIDRMHDGWAVPYYPNGNGFGDAVQVYGIMGWSYDTKHYQVAAIKIND